MNRIFKWGVYLFCYISLPYLQADSLNKDTFLQYKTVLTIAGSDPSGGAGIQADLKTFSALHCYGMSAITALTAQNTVGVQAIQSLPSEFVIAELHSIFEDIEVNAIKIGMLERKEIIQEVANYLKTHLDPKCPVIVDPVMFAKSGHQLIQDDAIEALKNEILPLASILTPNIHEACRLLEISAISSEEETEKAAFSLLELGPQAVIIKGKKDCLVIRDHPNPYWFEQEHVQTNNIHGTGCTFSAAIASFLARGDKVLEAVTKAKAYISNAVKAGSQYKIGHGKGPVFHFFSSWPETTFSEEAWEDSRLIFEEIINHPFIEELGNGTLSKSAFESYIQQDYLFLLDRTNAFSILALRAPNLELKSYLQELAKGSKEGAENIFQKYHLPTPCHEELKKTSACELYTQDMLTIATQGSFQEGLIFLAPCFQIYQKIGKYLEATSPASNPYKPWIDLYSSLEREQKTKKFTDVIDQLISSSNDKASLKKIFQKASNYEYDFWDSVYQ